MDRNCDAFIRSNNTYDILIARESLEISDDRAECIQNIRYKLMMLILLLMKQKILFIVLDSRL